MAMDYADIGGGSSAAVDDDGDRVGDRDKSDVLVCKSGIYNDVHFC